MGFLSFIYDLIVISGATVLGVGGAFLITSQFVYATPRHRDLDDEEEEETDFEKTYREEFEKLEVKERPPDDVIADYVSSVETPIGEVVMTYNAEMNTFYYYCDRRTIPIRFLDVGAQKFVIDNDCKVLYEEKPLEDDDQTEQAEQAEQVEHEELQNQSYYNWITSYFSREAPPPESEAEGQGEAEAEAETEPEQEEEKESSVFATYKKKPEINVKKAKQIEKIMNRYKYCGTLSDFNNNKEKVEQEALNISFSKFKEMVKNKTE
jgi:hypothetical protein